MIDCSTLLLLAIGLLFVLIGVMLARWVGEQRAEQKAHDAITGLERLIERLERQKD